jgi:hypothetical protein
MNPQAIIISLLYLTISAAMFWFESFITIICINMLFHLSIATSFVNVGAVFILLNVVLRNGFKIKLKLNPTETEKKSQLING